MEPWQIGAGSSVSMAPLRFAGYCNPFRAPRSTQGRAHSPHCCFPYLVGGMHTEALTKEGLQLFPALVAFDDFYLAGGTALALQIGHRHSVDFDLFSNDPIDQTLLTKVGRVFPSFPVQPVINNRDQLTAFIGSVKLTFLSYPFPLIEPFVSVEGLRMLSVKDESVHDRQAWNL